MDNLQQQIENLRTLQESYDAVAQAAEAYNTGKAELAANITSKGVEASASETLPELAEKVAAISQDTYEITGGELYGAQISGSLQTPNYWDLYAVLMQLLSDGRLVQYGGILLAEYYRGYDSLALSGAGAGGAYVVSDKDENGNFIKYDADIVHTWNTEFDGKGNRWVAYCFAEEYHDFDITDTGTSPSSIFIGRKVGTITSLVDGHASKIVVPDGNELLNFNSNGHTQNWAPKQTINLSDGSTSTLPLFVNSFNIEKLYISANKLTGGLFNSSTTDSRLSSVIIDVRDANGLYISSGTGNGNVIYTNLSEIVYKNVSGTFGLTYNGYNAFEGNFRNLSKIFFIDCEQFAFRIISHNATIAKFKHIFIGYKTNDKTKAIMFFGSGNNTSSPPNLTDVELKDGWCKPLGISLISTLTEENMYAHILQRLKQDEPDCGDGVTITLGSTNLAKLTSEESVQLLNDLTNIYGYTFA